MQQFSVPSPSDARDVVVGTAGQAYVYNGTFTPSLSTLDPVAGTWASTTLSGWSTVNNVSYGGVAAFGPYVFASDMNTAGSTDSPALGHRPLRHA